MSTVLLVEDNRIARAANQQLLNRAGHNVLVAEDGQRALKVAQASQPDLILLDMLLPLLGGEKVLQALKQDARTKSIPVIILTVLSKMNEAKLKQDGAAGFLEKTQVLDNPQLLLKMIDRVLRRPARAGVAPRADAVASSPLDAKR